MDNRATLPNKGKALWEPEFEEHYPYQSDGHAHKCPSCSAHDPWNDWYVFNDINTMQGHCQLQSMLVAHCGVAELMAAEFAFFGQPGHMPQNSAI